MGTRNRFNPGHPCCEIVTPPPTCLISAGWECNVKNGIVTADVTGWSVDAGTWNATQTWESGSVADTLTTSSSDARISCDTQQSQPLDDRMRVLHWVRVTNAADEAVILLAGYKVRVKSGSLAILSGSTVLTSKSVGIGTNLLKFVRVCTWHDDTASRDYLGVEWTYNSVTHVLVAEVTLGTNGTTEFGTDSVTGSVSFCHPEGDADHRDGHFYHNTVRTDGTDYDCTGCRMAECTWCPGGDAAPYLTVSIDGLAVFNPWYYTGDRCEDCEDGNGTYVLPPSLVASCAWQGTSVTLCRRLWIMLRGLHDYIFSIAGAEIIQNGSGWKLRVHVAEFFYGLPYGTGYHYSTQYAIYSKSYTAEESCADIDDDLTLEYYGSAYPPGCDGFDALTVHVTAS